MMVEMFFSVQCKTCFQHNHLSTPTKNMSNSLIEFPPASNTLHPSSNYKTIQPLTLIHHYHMGEDTTVSFEPEQSLLIHQLSYIVMNRAPVSFCLKDCTHLLFLPSIIRLGFCLEDIYQRSNLTMPASYLFNVTGTETETMSVRGETIP